MTQHTLLVTGSSGLVGSACVRHFAALGYAVHGIDNNARRQYFGPDGDTTPTLNRLVAEVPGFVHHAMDVRDREGLLALIRLVRPTLVVHAAAQPSHDLAAARPFEDFDVNAVGTLNLLEAVRRLATDTPFVFLSTNKVYGDAVNRLPLVERPTRFELADFRYVDGIREEMPIDESLHSLFGVSKAAADLLVQEYGRYHGMSTVCFRCGCLTGQSHAGAEQHGFLAYLARCAKEGRVYHVYGYKGKQVRDQLHAYDVCTAIKAFASNPWAAAVYNLGGGRDNSVSVIEAIAMVEEATGKRLAWEYVDQARRGDHCVYYSDTSRFCRDYPGWQVTNRLKDIIQELCCPSPSPRRAPSPA